MLDDSVATQKKDFSQTGSHVLVLQIACHVVPANRESSNSPTNDISVTIYSPSCESLECLIKYEM